MGVERAQHGSAALEGAVGKDPMKFAQQHMECGEAVALLRRPHAREPRLSTLSAFGRVKRCVLNVGAWLSEDMGMRDAFVHLCTLCASTQIDIDLQLLGVDERPSELTHSGRDRADGGARVRRHHAPERRATGCDVLSLVTLGHLVVARSCCVYMPGRVREGATNDRLVLKCSNTREVR